MCRAADAHEKKTKFYAEVEGIPSPFAIPPEAFTFVSGAEEIEQRQHEKRKRDKAKDKSRSRSPK